jgi:PTH1 family peptidyl-tRNA hydrolase
MGIQLIIGLRNPGDNYAKTRHNAGEWFINSLASDENLSFKVDKKFFADVALWQDARLILPNLYMNQSGKVVAAISQFYKIKPEEMLVVHDELDLPPGQIKLKKDGGHGGHNGLRDIIQHLGSKSFQRLRIGIGHPGHKDDVTNYVLGKPSNIDKIAILHAIDRAKDIIPCLVAGDIEKAMHQLHT